MLSRAAVNTASQAALLVLLSGALLLLLLLLADDSRRLWKGCRTGREWLSSCCVGRPEASASGCASSLKFAAAAAERAVGVDH